MGPEPGKAGPGVQGGASEGQALFSVWKGGWGVPGRRHLASIRVGWPAEPALHPAAMFRGSEGSTTPFPLGA